MGQISGNLRSMAAVSFYFICSLSMNFLNKVVVSTYSFNHPFFIMVCQVSSSRFQAPRGSPLMWPQGFSSSFISDSASTAWIMKMSGRNSARSVGSWQDGRQAWEGLKENLAAVTEWEMDKVEDISERTSEKTMLEGRHRILQHHYTYTFFQVLLHSTWKKVAIIWVRPVDSSKCSHLFEIIARPIWRLSEIQTCVKGQSEIDNDGSTEESLRYWQFRSRGCCTKDLLLDQKVLEHDEIGH